MLPLAAVALLVLVADRGAGCKEACAAHVKSPRVRANVCGRCFTEADRAAWAYALADLPDVSQAELEGLLTDADWAVRWAGIRALARRSGKTEGRVLSDWVEAKPQPACVTAVHAAGLKHQTTASLLQPAQAAACWERRDAITHELEIDLYSTEQRVRLDALTHLAAFLERPVSRVVLDAMKTRAKSTDDLSAALLVEAAHLLGPPAPRALLDLGKSEADEPLVNRLLEHWSKDLDAQRPRLASADRAARREAIAALADLAPLSAAELNRALDDPDAANRRAAATALAKGEGVSVSALAAKKLDPSLELEESTRLTWVAALGASHDPGCGATLRAALANERLPAAVRGACVPALADCDGEQAVPLLETLVQSKLPEVRAGLALAVVNLPRQSGGARLIDVALKDRDPAVLAAACRAAGALNKAPLAGRLLELTAHSDEAVRREAAAALGQLGSATAVTRLSHLATEDASGAVRESAAVALGQLGSASAVPALIRASEEDRDPKVKAAAISSLKQLGFGRAE